MKAIEPLNILFTSSGRRVALLRGFRDALLKLGVKGKVIAGDASVFSPAFYDADQGVVLPKAKDPSYIETLLDVAKKNQVKMIIPVTDYDLMILAKAREEFLSHGIVIVVSGPETVSIGRDKRKTFEFLKSIGIRTPRMIQTEEIRRLKIFPVFMKPYDGSGSIGAKKIENMEDLEYFLPRTPNPILLEYVEGEEYTVDCYTGLDGKPRCAVPRLRREVRAGEVSKATALFVSSIVESTLKIASSLPNPRGVLTIQCRLQNGSDEPCFFEINPRFGGGVPLSIKIGADFPRYLLEEMMGLTPSIEPTSFAWGLSMLRFDDAVYVSIDGKNGGILW